MSEAPPKIKPTETVRRGSLIAYFDGKVSWYGPIDRYPRDRVIQEIMVNPFDLVRVQLEIVKAQNAETAT